MERPTSGPLYLGDAEHLRLPVAATEHLFWSAALLCEHALIPSMPGHMPTQE